MDICGLSVRKIADRLISNKLSDCLSLNFNANNVNKPVIIQSIRYKKRPEVKKLIYLKFLDRSARLDYFIVFGSINGQVKLFK
jgi:hypothetical protein